MTVRLARSARRLLNDLSQHYARLGRPEALLNLRHAVSVAIDRIAADPHAGLAAPRPYPEIAEWRPAYRWILSGQYWVAYRPGPPTTIVAVFYDRVDIPSRLSENRS